MNQKVELYRLIFPSQHFSYGKMIVYLFSTKKPGNFICGTRRLLFSLLSEARYGAPFLGFLKMISPQIFPFFHYDANQQVPYKYLLSVCSFLLVACLFLLDRGFPMHLEQAVKDNNLLILGQLYLVLLYLTRI